MVSRLTLADLSLMRNCAPLVGLTASSARMAALLDPIVDLIHVGDALAMVTYGRANTLDLASELLAAHAEAVVRATRHAFVSVDLPFGSYEGSTRDAFVTAANLMARTGAQAVKLEGGAAMAETVAFLTARGIPVIGHIGLMPSHIHRLGGFKAQGLDMLSAQQAMEHARALEEAGAVALVLEALAEPVARAVVEASNLVTFGIGASPACDGQLLVTEDLLGLTEGPLPRFVEPYLDMAGQIRQAARSFADRVRTGQFPAPRHCYGMKTGSGVLQLVNATEDAN